MSRRDPLDNGTCVDPSEAHVTRDGAGILWTERSDQRAWSLLGGAGGGGQLCHLTPGPGCHVYVMRILVWERHSYHNLTVRAGWIKSFPRLWHGWAS